MKLLPWDKSWHRNGPISILPQLEKNKGTISSALGKALAKDVLAGQMVILEEAVDLLAYDNKQVRAGAAKIIEQVALSDPSLVVEFLPRLLPALDLAEPQTRWMAIHTLGLCAALDTPTALEALPKAATFIEAESGACLWGATVVYLGYIGATSAENARAALPVLERALQRVPKQTRQVLQSFLRLLDRADGETRAAIGRYAEAYAQSENKGIRTMAQKIAGRLT
jgi:hypothetical protein